MKRFALPALIFIFLIAYFLRVYYLPKGILTFGYDQARDAIISQNILGGDLKIQGPPASTPGLFHGVFYYYLLAPSYFFGNGSPIASAYWIALLNALTVFLVYWITLLFSKSKSASLLSSIFFAVSFEATQYATWLSNPTIGIWTVPLMYLGLWIWTKEKRKIGAVIGAVGLGLSVQSEIFLLYQAVPLAIWLYIQRKNLIKKDILLFLATFLLSISTMVASEIKFGFNSFSGILSLATSGDTLVAQKSLGDFFLLFLNQLGRVFSYNSYPGNIGYGGVFVLFAIVYVFLANYRKENNWPLLLVLWLFSHISVVSVGGTSTPFLLVGIGPAVSILLGLFVYQFLKNKKYIIFGVIFMIIIAGNLVSVFKQNSKGSVIFAIQKDMILKKELAAIDFTYQKAQGRTFSINTVTSPLWINIVWDYLYKWYGYPKYGYLPEWHGKDQIGQLGELPKTGESTEVYFFIVEPLTGIPLRFYEEEVGYENSISKVVGVVNFGDILLEERVRYK